MMRTSRARAMACRACSLTGSAVEEGVTSACIASGKNAPSKTACLLKLPFSTPPRAFLAGAEFSSRRTSHRSSVLLKLRTSSIASGTMLLRLNLEGWEKRVVCAKVTKSTVSLSVLDDALSQKTLPWSTSADTT